MKIISPKTPGEPLRVLCVEDSLPDAELMHEQLAETGFAAEMTVVDNRADLLQALDERQYDLVLLDFTLPNYDGFAAIDDCRTLAPTVPLIVISGTIGEDTAVELLKRGAMDYVFKDRMARLGFATQRALDTTRLEREARRAAEASERQLKLLETLASATTDLIFVKDIQGRYVFVNKAVERLTGRPASEIIGRDERAIFAPETAAALIQGNSSLLSLRSPITVEETVTTIDGSSHVLMSTLGVLLDEREVPFGLFRISRDVTEEKKLEARLGQAQKMEALGQLASGVAHDFNNMLGVILGYTELALSKLAPHDELRADLAAVLEAAERSAELVRQLLTFSRRQPTTPQVVDLNAEIEANLGMLGRIIGETIRVQFEAESDLGPVLIDRAQLSQVLINLSSNARDAMPLGGHIFIRTRKVLVNEGLPVATGIVPPGEYIILEFVDTGVGMGQEILPRVFDPFFSTKEPGKGTGLGLSTVYGIVRQHGGYIDVESQLGHGTKFAIYFPKAEVSVTRREVSTGEIPTGNENVVLAEDDVPLLDLTRSLLERLGYQVSAFQSALQAREYLLNTDKPVDLLIADVVMPDLDGITLALEAVQTRPNLSILFMSGHPNPLWDASLALKRATFLPKPFSLEILARKVREILDQNN
ncbi:MAG: response regulator [Thermoleophilia bacterium]|nr:response regulator [Thermoleophilia bacterium]